MGTFMETQLRFLSFSREDKVDKEKLNYEKTQIDRRKLSLKLKESGSNTAVDICEQRRKETAKIIIIARYYLIILSKGENDGCYERRSYSEAIGFCQIFSYFS